MLGAWEVALRRRVRVEDDVGYLAVFPLVVEEGPYLRARAPGIQVCPPYGYKRGVPAPLMRVERGGGAGPTTHIVLC